MLPLSLPRGKELFPRAISPREAVPRPPWKIALSHQQRVSSPRQASLVDSTLSLAESDNSQVGSSLASPEDSTLSLTESEISQAGSSQAFPVDSTLSLAEGDISQAGSSQASPEDSTLSVAESEISQAGSSQASLEDNTLSPAESELSQASTLSSVAVRPLARFRTRQAGTPREVSNVSW